MKLALADLVSIMQEQIHCVKRKVILIPLSVRTNSRLWCFHTWNLKQFFITLVVVSRCLLCCFFFTFYFSLMVNVNVMIHSYKHREKSSVSWKYNMLIIVTSCGLFWKCTYLAFNSHTSLYNSQWFLFPNLNTVFFYP